MGGCQNYGPFLGPYYIVRHLSFRVPKKGGPYFNTAPLINLGYPIRDPNFDNHPFVALGSPGLKAARLRRGGERPGLGFRDSERV